MKRGPWIGWEVLLRRVRNAVGYRSRSYRLGSLLVDTLAVISKEGIRGIGLLKLRYGGGRAKWLRLRSLRHPILVRPGTDDAGAVINNVVREEYGQLPRGFRPRLIVDAGAYIGDTAAYFLSRFPDATCVALEPNPDSYLQAKINLEPYGFRARLINRALWSCSASLKFAGRQTGASISDAGFEIETETIPSILETLETPQIDLLKIDIEGAEEVVIPAGARTWLPLTRVLLMETHGLRIERTVMPILTAAGFRCDRFRTVWYCKNEEAEHFLDS